MTTIFAKQLIKEYLNYNSKSLVESKLSTSNLKKFSTVINNILKQDFRINKIAHDFKKVSRREITFELDPSVKMNKDYKTWKKFYNIVLKETGFDVEHYVPVTSGNNRFFLKSFNDSFDSEKIIKAIVEFKTSIRDRYRPSDVDSSDVDEDEIDGVLFHQIKLLNGLIDSLKLEKGFYSEDSLNDLADRSSYAKTYNNFIDEYFDTSIDRSYRRIDQLIKDVIEIANG